MKWNIHRLSSRPKLLQLPQLKREWCYLWEPAKKKKKRVNLCLQSKDTLCWCFALRESLQSEAERRASRRILWRPPQLRQRTGNCCAFSQFHVAPSASFSLPISTLLLWYLSGAVRFSSRLPTLSTHYFLWIDAQKNTVFYCFPSCGSQVGPFHVRGGAGFLWCTGSLGSLPVWGRLLIQPLSHHCSPN